MRKFHGILAGVGAVWLVASCGTGGAPPIGAAGPGPGGPEDAMRRYKVLTAETLCPATPTPTPTGTGACNAVGGISTTLSVSAVERDGPDFVNVLYSPGGTNYLGTTGTVVFSTGGGGETIATVTALLDSFVGPEVDPIFVTIVVDVTNGAYQLTTEDDAPNASGPFSTSFEAGAQCEPFFVIQVN